ncbi:hypothetical protein LUZ61_002508 [Rhynchospora tenuis]|uniref:Dirigent protein n=1 Tax=Rhynchospora tenuis TaxID=198213 RepID=A0AAD6ERR5_9POAL|nr:hypothetical protein LUZ61_002508 [Rhynchospora tenuis]
MDSIPAKKELNLRLFMYHTPLGPNKNQTTIVQSNAANSFGTVAINDWPCYDGLGNDAKLIARAQGMHLQAGVQQGRWYNSLNLEFEDPKYKKDSSLQVMGTVVESGEWSILGGTGEFTLAEGVIYKRFVEQRSDGNIMELNIRAFYTTLPDHKWSSN